MFFLFFFNDTATTEIYTLSLHDALPISVFQDFHDIFGDFFGFEDLFGGGGRRGRSRAQRGSDLRYDMSLTFEEASTGDRKSTRLNSSHSQISYAVFCLKKKKRTTYTYLARPKIRNHSYMHLNLPTTTIHDSCHESTSLMSPTARVLSPPHV